MKGKVLLALLFGAIVMTIAAQETESQEEVIVVVADSQETESDFQEIVTDFQEVETDFQEVETDFQEVTTDSQKVISRFPVGYTTYFKHNKTDDNWFIAIAGGAGVFVGDQSGKAGFASRLNFAPQISLGKWFNPYIAFRVQANGGQMKNYIYGPFDSKGTGEIDLKFGKHTVVQDAKYIAGHVDLLLDVINLWNPYEPDRQLHLIPWIGMGYAQRFETKLAPSDMPYLFGSSKDVKNGGSGFVVEFDRNEHYYPRSQTPTLNLGLQLAYRLDDRIDLTAELQGTLLNERFNRVKGGILNDGIVLASVGLAYKLNRSDFDILPEQQAMDLALLEELNNRVNELRAENEELSKLAIVHETQIYKADNAIYFRLNSSKIESSQQLVLYHMSQFVKEYNIPIVVIGYADKKTGTAPYNKKLSERRAKAVFKALVEQHDVPPNLIFIDWKGDTEQPYPHNDWNRAVRIKEYK